MFFYLLTLCVAHAAQMSTGQMNHPCPKFAPHDRSFNGRAVRFGRLEPPSAVVAHILSFASSDSFLGFHAVVAVNTQWFTAAQSLTVMHLDPPLAYFTLETLLRALRKIQIKYPNARDVHLGSVDIGKGVPTLGDCLDLLDRVVSFKLYDHVSPIAEWGPAMRKTLFFWLRSLRRLRNISVGPRWHDGVFFDLCVSIVDYGARRHASSSLKRRIIAVNGVRPTRCASDNRRYFYPHARGRCQKPGCSDVLCTFCARNGQCWGCAVGARSQVCAPP